MYTSITYTLTYTSSLFPKKALLCTINTELYYQYSSRLVVQVCCSCPVNFLSSLQGSRSAYHTYYLLVVASIDQVLQLSLLRPQHADLGHAADTVTQHTHPYRLRLSLLRFDLFWKNTTQLSVLVYTCVLYKLGTSILLYSFSKGFDDGTSAK